MPIDSDLSPSRSADLGQQREMRCRHILERRNAHQPVDRKPMHRLAALDEGVGLLRQDACLLRLGAGVDLDQQARPAPLSCHLLGERAGDLVAVDGVDGVEQGDGILRLVGLQRADQVQLDSRRFQAQRRPFAHRLLHPVLAEDPLAAGDHRPDRRGVEGLRDGDQAHRAGRPSGHRFRRGDAAADFAECFCLHLRPVPPVRPRSGPLVPRLRPA